MVDITQFTLNPEQERGILLYASNAHGNLLNNFSLRPHLEEIDRSYMREKNWTEAQVRARLANARGDAHKIQDITVPIVMPQVEAALAYMVQVFLTGYPIFGVEADPTNEDAALQIETIIAENAIRAKSPKELMMFFRDGLKYNIHAVELDWQKRTVWDIETDLTAPGSTSAKPKQTTWAGNVIKRMDMYNTFFDPRVHPTQIHTDGEYAGYIEVMSRVRMKTFVNNLFPNVAKSVIVRALASTPTGNATTGSSTPYSYYQPIINPWPLMDRAQIGTFDWLSWANAVPINKGGLRYSNIYEVMTYYARIIPDDFDMRVPAPNTPQVWKFIIVNGTVILTAERMSNAHNWIPIFFGQPIEDGLDFQTKSFAQNVGDMQDVASALISGYLASKRRLVGDRALYDPSRVREKDINNSNPAAKIPVRPSAYGKPVGEAVYAFPYRDEQVNSMLQGAQQVQKWADVINEQNASTQGQFTKGNRTKHEYDDVMQHGDDRNQVMAMTTEGNVFTDMKQGMLLNILQYQQEDVIYNRERKLQVPIKPTDLRTAAVHFKVSDGESPADKIMAGDEFQTALQVIGTSPAVASGYNIAPLFSYIMKQRGADLRPFEKSALQLQFEQQTQAWQQVATAAIQAGKQPPPQPVPSPQLQQEMQQKQANGGVNPSPTDAALVSTVNNGTGTSASPIAPQTSNPANFQQGQPPLQ